MSFPTAARIWLYCFNQKGEGNIPQAGLDKRTLSERHYATTLNIPFVFSANGDGFVFHDCTGTSVPREANLPLDAFPSPADLWARHRAWKGLAPEAEKIVLQDYYEDGSGNRHPTQRP